MLLRASGAAERDPVRFAYLDALARRAAKQPASIRQALAARIGAAADELASRPAPSPAAIAPSDTASPLAELLAYIGQQAHALPDAASAAAPQGDLRPKAKASGESHRRPAPELKSVTYFRDEWSKLSTEQQLTQTLAQAPENAGPMNSQHLVLRSLQVMRDIAPDYLHGFMSWVDALIWLEHAAPTRPAPARAVANEGQPAKRVVKSSPKRR
ncbi:MAG: DUF2894 domain-containing protein [Dechloromonas sp.]|nr:MAG: DUF2894 domain-containing protein [Dechloromonas sp.]